MTAISTASAKILLTGHYLNIARGAGELPPNPCFTEWRFGPDVTVYGASVRSPRR